MQLLKMKFGESYRIFFGFLGLHFYDNTSETGFERKALSNRRTQAC